MTDNPIEVAWLVQEGINDEYLPQLRQAVVDRGMELRTFHHSKESPDSIAQWFQEEDCVVFHGSLNYARELMGRQPYWCVWADPWSFECTTYYPRLRDDKGFTPLLNGNYIMLPAGDLPARKMWLSDVTGGCGQLFVRPNKGTKQFTGFVLNLDKDIHDQIDLHMHRPCPEDLILAAPAHRLGREWRLICTKQSVVAGSQYMRAGKPEIQPGVPNAVVELANQTISKCGFIRDPMFTMDIAEVCGLGARLAVIELNSFGAAGWYGALIPDIVDAASQQAVGEYKIIWDIL